MLVLEAQTISGAHIIIYSTDADADREFFRDALGLTNVDAGGGWLTFALPPSELALHPARNNDVHEFYLICEDLTAFVTRMRDLGVRCGPLQEQAWGVLAQVPLLGGGSLGVYQPRHERP